MAINLAKEEKAAIIEKFGKDAKDSGSAEVQIALLTQKITELTEHLKINKKDYLSWEISSADKTALMNVVVIGNTGECEYGFEIYDGETLVASQEMSTDNTFLMNPHKLLKGYRYSEYTMRVIVNTGDGNVYFRNVPVTIVPVRI